ncbi:SDR family NAD(P)-dependent oxidoreductase [Planococcus sp. 107-1]|uniref:SDR family NAD(P)-dependent oxidoreductase n=1 Tax=Planococcus sp. 107-1 TaxID=2908840 RepID=UPI001F32E5C4|nr:SDR family NAD(P)-dependent oxidoreductase [Planococcus sp. 107-1]UJF28117.1 SDR family NAD(P)-dependent oxidoreductase [Planococcus sp. 107-1]
MGTYTLLEHFLFPPVLFNRPKLVKALSGKTILITGASSGIGRSLAYLLADIPCHLILVARRETILLEIKEEIESPHTEVSVFGADLRNREQLAGLLKFLHKLPKGLDIAVSNAGISIYRPIEDSLDRFHDFTRTMAINYFAPVELMLSIIPLLKKNSGHVVNVSTINALLVPFPFWAAYQASKSAFDVWFRSASPEMNAMGIATTTIYLPLVKTPMILPTPAYQKAAAMEPDHVAKLIGTAIYKKKKRHMPWWLIFGQFGSVIFRRFFETALPRIIRKGERL